MFLIYIGLLILFQYQTIYIDFLENSKRTAILYMLGNSFMIRHKELFIENIIVYMLSLVGGVVLNVMPVGMLIMTIGMIFLFDVIFMHVVLRVFERKGIATILKGFWISIVKIENLSKKFGSRVIFENFSLEINENEFVVIQGKSGSGKSTLLNMIGLMDKPNAGTITLFGEKNVVPFLKKTEKLLKHQIGYLFQNFALIENKDVLYNMKIAIEHFSTKKTSKSHLH